jgi:hypothetical protein
MVGIFRCAVHENGAKEVYCIPAICPDKVRLGIARSLAGISCCFDSQLVRHPISRILPARAPPNTLRTAYVTITLRA